MGEMIYHGKVKQVWSTDNPDIIEFRYTDQISVFDQIIPDPSFRPGSFCWGWVRFLEILFPAFRFPAFYRFHDAVPRGHAWFCCGHDGFLPNPAIPFGEPVWWKSWFPPCLRFPVEFPAWWWFHWFLPRFLTHILKWNWTTKRLVIPLFLFVSLGSWVQSHTADF